MSPQGRVAVATATATDRSLSSGRLGLSAPTSCLVLLDTAAVDEAGRLNPPSLIGPHGVFTVFVFFESRPNGKRAEEKYPRRSLKTWTMYQINTGGTSGSEIETKQRFKINDLKWSSFPT